MRAPPEIHPSMVEIWAADRHARGNPFVEHVSGMRAGEHPVTAALTIWLRTLVLGLFGVTSFMVLHAAMVAVPVGAAFTSRA